MTKEALKQALNFDPETGAFTWAVKRSRVAPGDAAGSLLNTGYVLIKIDQRAFLAHRLAWLWVHGVMPSGHIDHINGDRSDNRICNLRECTVSENHCNTKLCKANSSGVKGVSWNKKDRVWRARVKVKGVEHHLGSFPSIALAEIAAREGREKLHKEFFNHG